MMNEPGYEHLARILEDAYNQSAFGKGKIRHANGRSFDQQPIMHIARMSGLAGHIYQVMKKSQEAQSMADRGEKDKAIQEMYGAIIYSAAAILLLEEQLAIVPVSKFEDDMGEALAHRMSNGGHSDA